jgi:hypothetical protein
VGLDDELKGGGASRGARVCIGRALIFLSDVGYPDWNIERPAIRQRRSSTRRLLQWLTGRCFVCGRRLIAHSIHEQAKCEFTPLPIQLPENHDDQAVA